MRSKILFLILCVLTEITYSVKVNFELFITPFFPLSMCIPGTEQIIDNGVFLA